MRRESIVRIIIHENRRSVRVQHLELDNWHQDGGPKALTRTRPLRVRHHQQGSRSRWGIRSFRRHRRRYHRRRQPVGEHRLRRRRPGERRRCWLQARHRPRLHSGRSQLQLGLGAGTSGARDAGSRPFLGRERHPHLREWARALGPGVWTLGRSQRPHDCRRVLCRRCDAELRAECCRSRQRLRLCSQRIFPPKLGRPGLAQGA
mmetsp:Transcript_9632/g.39446  ORF Transcript_9632/g.39446 Transcript_9632/m.39446 type:complete len:204 (+) Transcript_9632:1968-2579(+)